MTTLDQIQQRANERQALWRIAAHKKLTASQRQRLHAITGELDTLWDRHRRELASRGFVVAAKDTPTLAAA